jgi:hypothetical protein
LSDLEDWTESLQEFTQPSKLPRKSRLNNQSSSTLNMDHRKHVEDDVQSNYSDDSCYTFTGSVASMGRRASRPASVLMRSDTNDHLSQYTETMVRWIS